MRPALVLITLLAIAAAAISQPEANNGTPHPDAAKGKDVFARRCGGCHSLDRPIEGPPLRNVYGRRAGTWPDFQYSEALKNSKLTWNEDLLDKWLTDTEALVPDNDMSFRVASRDERRDIIAYLKSLSRGTMSSSSGPP
jgi:cytochrome c